MSESKPLPLMDDGISNGSGHRPRLRDRLLLQEDLNFLLTNRIPRMWLGRLMGRFSRVRSRWLTRISIHVWRAFTDLNLDESRHQHFDSLQECFTRELKAGARPIDPAPQVMVSPSDGIVGAAGRVEGTRLIQAKGLTYSLVDLLGTAEAAEAYRDGVYVTLRLTSAMYHRFHSPDAARVAHVTYISGDTWNVNPIAVRRIRELFCRNERAIVHLRLETGQPMALVAVAAVLVASIRLHCLGVMFHPRWPGPDQIPCSVPVHRGQELGWFEHGSTIIVFAPAGFKLCPEIVEGGVIRMGQRLMCRN